MVREIAKEKVLFEIDGFQVIEGHTYIVDNKPDGDAPEGYVREGSTKLPSVGIWDSFQFPYDRDAMLWDTGFYETSKCYRSMEDTAAKTALKQAVENVLKPYRKHIGNPEAFEQHNEASFNESRHIFRVQKGDSFNTKSPEKLLRLYVALLGRKLTPEDQAGSPTFIDSSFIIKDVTSKSALAENTTSLFFDAVGAFTSLYAKDPELTCAVLNYIDINALPTTPVTTLQKLLQNRLQDNLSELNSFLRHMEEATTEQGVYKYTIFNLFKMKSNFIKELSIRGGKVFWGEIELGADYRGAADNVVKSPAFAEVKDQIMAYNK